jgi:hypothetical protein
MVRPVAALCVAALVLAACGGNDDASPTKNLALGTSPSVLGQASVNPKGSSGGECSPLGAIYRSNPVVVPPPEPNSAEQSYSGDECSFYEQYRSFPSIGRYEFIWDAAKTPQSASGRPVIVEVSRDGIVWTSLATEWSPRKPHSAVAYLTMAGNLRVRVRPS